MGFFYFLFKAYGAVHWDSIQGEENQRVALAYDTDLLRTFNDQFQAQRAPVLKGVATNFGAMVARLFY